MMKTNKDIFQILNEFNLSNGKECKPFEEWTQSEVNEWLNKLEEFDRE